MVGMAPTPDGVGVLVGRLSMVACFPFGDATYLLSTRAFGLNRPWSEWAPPRTEAGIGVLPRRLRRGAARFSGFEGGAILNNAVVAMTAAH